MSLRGLFLEGVTAHFVSSLLGNTMLDFTRRLTHWELSSRTLLHGWSDATWWGEGNKKAAFTELRNLAAFHIRKWILNEPDVIAGIVEEYRASEID